MDPSGGVTPLHPPFPSRMFVVGEEPLSIRVTPYHKPSCITKILNASGEDEVRVIMEFPFGKLVEIAEEPSFSGWFGCFLLFRQLKVALLSRSMVTRRLEITARPHLLVSLSITHLHLVDRDANFNLVSIVVAYFKYLHLFYYYVDPFSFSEGYHYWSCFSKANIFAWTYIGRSPTN